MNDYYNNQYTGVAYINRIRMVPVSRGDDFRALTLSVKSGKKDPETGKAELTTQLDCKIVGTQAIAMFDRLLDKVDYTGDKKPVISASFQVGDIYPDGYVSKTGENAGKQQFVMKGRLLKLQHVYLNGERFAEEIDGPVLDGPVKLSQDDPDFDEKVNNLKSKGYCYDSEEALWYKPTLKEDSEAA
ncbi:MAG: DUF3577 domain-containing protein [Gammaproteobacteria bacterium]